MVNKKESRETADFVKSLQAANKSVTEEQALLVYGVVAAAQILLNVPAGSRITVDRLK